MERSERGEFWGGVMGIVGLGGGGVLGYLDCGR